MAGNSAAQTMEQMVATFRAAFGVSTATFMGQNLGAEKHDRVRKSFWHHMWLVAVVNTVIAMSVMLLNPFWPKIFLGDDAAAIEYAVSRNNLVMVASIATALSAVISHAIQAFGYPIFGTLNAVIWVLGLRTVWMTFVYPTYPTYMCLIQCFAVTWILSMLSYAVIFFVIYRRYRKGKYHTFVARPNVARSRSDSYTRSFVFTKIESVNIFTSVSKVKVLIFES